MRLHALLSIRPLPKMASLTRLYGATAVLCLIFSAPLWMSPVAASLRGQWVDSAFSEVLSKKYGSPVIVANVRFERWYSVRFGAFGVDSNEGKPLIRATGGTLRLRQLDLSGKRPSETEVRFENIAFTKEYYGSSRAAGTWGFLLRKPIQIEELCFLVKQNRSGMQVVVTDCRSDGVEIAGGVEVERSGTYRDDLRVSVSPWTAIRSMV